MKKQPTKIAITGRLRSGKDTVVSLLKEQLTGKTLSLAFGDKVKEFAHALFPDVPHVPKPRELYQFMNVMRDYDPDVWVKQLDKTLQNEISSYDNILITDLRQGNEADYCRKNGFTIIKVESDTNIRKQRVLDSGETWNEEFESHPSETGVDKIRPDINIGNNDTLEELESIVEDIISDIKQTYLNNTELAIHYNKSALDNHTFYWFESDGMTLNVIEPSEQFWKERLESEDLPTGIKINIFTYAHDTLDTRNITDVELLIPSIASKDDVTIYYPRDLATDKEGLLYTHDYKVSLVNYKVLPSTTVSYSGSDIVLENKGIHLINPDCKQLDSDTVLDNTNIVYLDGRYAFTDDNRAQETIDFSNELSKRGTALKIYGIKGDK